MRLIFSAFCCFSILNVFGMDVQHVEQAYNPDKNYVSAVKISQEPLQAEDVSNICLVRHASTAVSHNIVQGRKLNPKILMDAETVSKIDDLKTLPWNALYSGSSDRATETFQNLASYTHLNVCSSFLFDEQDLGEFEGMGKKEVLHNNEFVKMSFDPNYKVENVETGAEVLNRLLYGMSESAKHGKLIGICTSYCAMNWLFKWATQNYKKTISIDHLEVMMFQYSPSTNTYYFTNQKLKNAEEISNILEL